jgi:hypothetical protein
MSAPTDAGTYDSQDVLYVAMVASEMFYLSSPQDFLLIGKEDQIVFSSIPQQYVAIGSGGVEAFYESYSLTAEASILYAWARDSKNEKISIQPETAVCIKMVEIIGEPI